MVALLLDLVEVIHHEELVQHKLERIDQLLLVLLGLTRRRLVSLDLYLSDHDFDDDLEHDGIVHNETSLGALSLVTMQSLLGNLLEEVEVDGVIGALFQLFEPILVEELAKVFSESVEELVE